jgi:parallel beta-helix repeat protein
MFYEKKVLPFLYVLCLLILIFHFSNTISIKPVSARTIHVPDEFETIQEAINNASDGDIIKVASGIYYEHLYVNKSITLVGDPANPTTTIIDAMTNGTAITLEASGINITGFTIRNAGSHYGIKSERDLPTNDKHVITNNIITTSTYGIKLATSNRNTIKNNTITDVSMVGIYLDNSDRNYIAENNISQTDTAIKLLYSSTNTLTRNKISQIFFGIYVTDSSTGNSITQNYVSAEDIAVYLGVDSDSNIVDHNTIANSARAIYFYESRNGEVNYNHLMGNAYGIRVWMTTITDTSHVITNNKVLFGSRAIDLKGASGNTFMGNWLQENTYGAYLTESPYNLFYRNNFIQNTMQVYTDSINSWNFTDEGNYWSDYEGEDLDGDGIGEDPYPIIPGYDYYPLMEPWSEHDIAVENITISDNEVYLGQQINITVTVENEGKAGISETFNVTIKYNETIIETQTVIELAPGYNTTLTFSWNTTQTKAGSYTISAEASIVTDELDTIDNTLIYGTALVKLPGDVNGDGIVDAFDIFYLSEAYGSMSGDPEWNPDRDFNDDGMVDVLDLFALSKNYGKKI